MTLFLWKLAERREALKNRDRDLLNLLRQSKKLKKTSGGRQPSQRKRMFKLERYKSTRAASQQLMKVNTA